MALEQQRVLFPPDEEPTASDRNAPVRVNDSVEGFRAAITALAPWFGSNRMLGPEVARHLEDCEWVGVPFAGGMCEVPHIRARTVVVNDIHNAIITLGRVTSDSVLGPKLYRRLRRKVLHSTELQDAQDRCRDMEACAEDTDEQLGNL